MHSERDRITSELLLTRYQRGDTSALDELVRLWESRLFYFIRRLVGDEEDAWDALQETWVALVKGVGKLQNPGSLPVWLYRTARHKAMDRLRSKYSAPTAATECEDVPEAETAAEVQFDDAELVHHALTELSLCHREALTLFFLQDLSIEDISQVLGIAAGTVKSRLHYAKKALRSILEEEGYNNEPAG